MSALKQHHSNVARLSLASSRAIESTRLLLEENDEPVVTWLRSQVELISEEEMRSAGSEGTDAFFERVRAAVTPSAALLILPKHAKAIQLLIPAFKDELDKELRDGSADIVDALVAGAGSDVASFYSQATEQHLVAPGVDLVPRHHPEHATPSELFVSAHVVPGPPRLVELYLEVARVTDRTIAATPYVLFHELVCHGLAGEVRDGPRTCDPASPFSEGFMDHVAAQLHEQALDSSQDGMRLRQCVRDRTSARLWGRDYQASRYIFGGQVGSPLVLREIELRRVGRDAAATLERMFVDARVEPEFWKWALRLNASDLTHDERDDFVTAIALALASNASDLAEQLAPLSEPDQIAQWTTGWLGRLPDL